MGVYGIAVLSFFSSSILVILILRCSIALSSRPEVYDFSSFWLAFSVKELRSFTVLWYHLFALSCLIQANTMCKGNNSKLNRLIKVNNYFKALDLMVNDYSSGGGTGYSGFLWI